MSPAFPLPSKPLGNLTAANTVPGLTLTSGSGKATTKPVAKESSSELPPAVKKAVKEFMQNGLEREAAGNCSTAVQIFQQILQLEPDNTAALCASARIWSKASKHSRATELVAMLEERKKRPLQLTRVEELAKMWAVPTMHPSQLAACPAAR